MFSLVPWKDRPQKYKLKWTWGMDISKEVGGDYTTLIIPQVISDVITILEIYGPNDPKPYLIMKDL